MKKLLLILLIAPVLSFGQSKIPFGGNTGLDTANTPNSLRTAKLLVLPFYLGPDSLVLGMAPGNQSVMPFTKSMIQNWANQNGYLIPADTVNKWIGIGWLPSLMKYPDTLSRLITTKTYVDSAGLVVLSDYASLISYGGLATKAFIPDTNIGGFFSKTSASLVDDTGVIVPGASGSHWVRSIQGQSILPRWFGAKADSVADDWNALQKAQYAGVRYKMPVYIKQGYYLTSQKVIVPTGSTTFCDQGAQFSALTYGQTVVYMGVNSYWNGGTVRLGTNGMCGFEFDGALRFTNGAVNHTLMNTRVQGGNVKGQKSYWLHGSGLNNDVQAVKMYNCKSTSSPDGFVLESSNTSKVYNNILTDIWAGNADTAVIINNTTNSTAGGANYNKISFSALPASTVQTSGCKLMYCNSSNNEVIVQNSNWILTSAGWADKAAFTFSALSENNTLDLRASEAKYRHVNNYGSNNQILSLSYNSVNILEYRDLTYLITSVPGNYKAWEVAANAAITELSVNFKSGTLFFPIDTFRTLAPIKLKSKIHITGQNKYGTVLYNLGVGLVRGSVFNIGLSQQAAYQTGMTEYRINQINPGNKISMSTAAEAGNIIPGTPYMIRLGYFPTPSTDTIIGPNSSQWATIAHIDSVNASTGSVYIRECFEDTIKPVTGLVMQITNLQNALFKGDSCFIVEDVEIDNLTMMSENSSPFIADAVLNGKYTNLVFRKGLYGGGGNGKIRNQYVGCLFYYKNRAWESAECSGWNTIRDCDFYKVLGETRGAEKEMELQIYDVVTNCNIYNPLSTEANAIRVRAHAYVNGLKIVGSFSGPLLTIAGNYNTINKIDIQNLRNTTRSIASGTVNTLDTSVTEIPVYYNTISNGTFTGIMDSTAASYNTDLKGDFNNFIGNKFINQGTNRKFNFNGVGDVFSNCFYDHPAPPTITELTAGRTAINNIMYTGGFYPQFPYYTADSASFHDLPTTITDSIVYTGFGGTAAYTSAKHKIVKVGRHVWWEAVIVLSGSGATTTTAVTIPIPSWLPQPVSNGLTGTTNEQFPCIADLFSNANGSTTLTTAKVVNRPGTLASKSVQITKASGTVLNIWVKSDWETAN